ncbi:MAG: RagB/SusD family nutrient uptake outer membrane protein [Bacteroides sp.]
MRKLVSTLLLFLGLCSSCNFLDTSVYDQLGESNLYRNEASCMSGLAGVYDVLGYSDVYGQNLWGDLDSGTDILVYNREYGKNNLQVSMYTYNNTDATLNNTWRALYMGVNRANDYMDLISQRTDKECGGASKKAMFIAEAKALRAVFYMNLLSFWGEVPLRITSIRDLSTQLLKKSPQQDVFNQIIKDLSEAESGCLPATSLNTPGRISRTTVQALLARTYLWQSGYPTYANTWDKALSYARKVRDSKLHSLYPETDGKNGYIALFINMCSNKYDLTARESMFEVEFYGNGLEKSNESGKVGLYNGISQGQVDDPDVPFAYAWYNATRILFRLYEPTGDARKWWNFADYSYKRNEQTKRIEKLYLTEAQKITYEKVPVTRNPGKWRAEYDPIRPWARNNSSINYPIMRYADVLLMIAEASNEMSGPSQEVIDAINLIRGRAGATLIQLADYVDKEALRRFIFEERTRELCFEVPRRMELRRMGEQFYFDQINLLKDQGVDINRQPIGYQYDDVHATPAINIGIRHLYMPIPQIELNTNPICGQAPNW